MEKGGGVGKLWVSFANHNLLKSKSIPNKCGNRSVINSPYPSLCGASYWPWPWPPAVRQMESSEVKTERMPRLCRPNHQNLMQHLRQGPQSQAYKPRPYSYRRTCLVVLFFGVVCFSYIQICFLQEWGSLNFIRLCLQSLALYTLHTVHINEYIRRSSLLELDMNSCHRHALYPGPGRWILSWIFIVLWGLWNLFDVVFIFCIGSRPAIRDSAGSMRFQIWRARHV